MLLSSERAATTIYDLAAKHCQIRVSKLLSLTPKWEIILFLVASTGDRLAPSGAALSLHIYLTSTGDESAARQTLAN